MNFSEMPVLLNNLEKIFKLKRSYFTYIPLKENKPGVKDLMCGFFEGMTGWLVCFAVLGIEPRALHKLLNYILSPMCALSLCPLQNVTIYSTYKPCILILIS
jgi:hypothetical protein